MNTVKLSCRGYKWKMFRERVTSEKKETHFTNIITFKKNHNALILCVLYGHFNFTIN
jgi:hypothetical protein